MRHVSQLRALSAVAVLLVIPAYGDRDPGTGGRTVVAPATAASARVGALFEGGLDGDHFCTASVVHSADRNLIVTAAHCLDGQDDAVFVPGYRDGRAPYGTWPVEDTYTDDAWQEDGSEDDDVAFAVLGAGSLTGARVEDAVGAARLATPPPSDATADATPDTTATATAGTTAAPDTTATADATATAGAADTVTVTGYPSDADSPLTCTNRTTRYGATQQRIECPGYSGGTSGSPWEAADGSVVGVIGGYEEGGDDPDVSYSIVFGPSTAELFRLAGGEGC
ncbi:MULTISPECIES: trypsin-like serine protease [unclassified Streptomyces]|uniref:trypsin-like serine peptidase n=1 Tax=unclassified Streptomyces TaxID=2593676 RepID=UPI00340D8A2F